jgi:hypothetical protein
VSNLAARLASGRAAAERIMTDTCSITRITGQTLNETTGAWTDVTSTVYTGKCRVQLRNMQVASLPLSGDRQVVALQLEVWIPMSSTSPTVGDNVTITAAVHDSTLVGRVFRVREEMHKSHATARRLVVQEEQT